ncbi:pilus assembly protein PilM [Vulgatibacter sp.]|uniref:pilus assembly protein PilM n=1 Tax=Vulgatibacter sp. TaxID=1971226 RepID=UPI00356AD28D
MAQKILGLDIGAHSVKAVLLEGTLRGWELKGHAIAPLGPVEAAPEPAAPAVAEEGAEGAAAANGEQQEAAIDLRLSRAIATVAEQLGGLRADLTAVALPGTSAATPLVTLPFTDAKKVEATLGFEVESLLPFDIDDAFYDYQVLSQQDGKSDLLVGVVRREEFSQLVEQLHTAGVDPRVITLPGLGLEPLAADLAVRNGVGHDEQAAILDLGHDRSVLTVVQGGSPDGKQPPHLVFTRTFSGGGASLPEGSSDLENDALLRRKVQMLLREVRQSLRAAQTRTRRPVGRIFLAGALSQLPGLGALLAHELNVPVDPVTLPGDAAAKIPAEQQPAYAQALGLALRAQARGGQKLLNLRKGAFAYKGDLDYLKGKTSRLVAFAAVLVVLFAGNFWAKLQTVKAQEAKLDDALCQVTQNVLGTCEQDFNIALSKLQGGDTMAAQIPTASAMEVFTEAITRMPSEAGVKFEEVDVTLERLRLKGTVDSFDGVDQVVGGLKKSRCIGEIKRGRVQRNRSEKIEFTLDALYVCGQNADKIASAGTGG